MNGPNKPECFSWEAFLAESNVCDPGVVFKTIYFIRNLQMGAII
jgi:hypothetical protein